MIKKKVHLETCADVLSCLIGQPPQPVLQDRRGIEEEISRRLAETLKMTPSSITSTTSHNPFSPRNNPADPPTLSVPSTNQTNTAPPNAPSSELPPNIKPIQFQWEENLNFDVSVSIFYFTYSHKQQLQHCVLILFFRHKYP